MFLGCLVNKELYERRMDELLDADRDGYRSALEGGDDGDDTNVDVSPGASETPYDGVDQDCDGIDLVDVDGDGSPGASGGDGEDCDDGDGSVFPGAEDACYDGIDADCANNDDDDCDGDGYPRDADCDDADPQIFPGGTESWENLDADNNCDDALSDQVASPVSEVGTRIIPSDAAERFGNGLGPIIDLDGDGLDEMWITAPYEGGEFPYLGAVYLLRGANVTIGTDIHLSEAALLGTEEDELLGTSATVGDVDGDGISEFYVSAIGRNGNAGAVYAVLPEDLDDATGSHPSTISHMFITGSAGDYLGTRIVSDRDFDGDGVDDLLVEASGSRKVALFSLPGPGESGLADADVSWVTEPGRWLSVTGLADADGDGTDDIGIVQGNTPAGTVGARGRWMESPPGGSTTGWNGLRNPPPHPRLHPGRHARPALTSTEVAGAHAPPRERRHPDAQQRVGAALPGPGLWPPELALCRECRVGPQPRDPDGPRCDLPPARDC